MISFKLINSLTNFVEGDKFMLGLILRQPGFTYSACGQFIKHCERIQKQRIR